MNPTERINDLKAEMQNLGYVEDEVNAFIYDFLGEKEIEVLNEEEYTKLISYLYSYVMFAKKSKKVAT